MKAIGKDALRVNKNTRVQRPRLKSDVQANGYLVDRPLYYNSPMRSMPLHSNEAVSAK